jgi:predicted RND superfamily exporter protein
MVQYRKKSNSPIWGSIVLLIVLHSQLVLPVAYQLKHIKFLMRLEDILPRNYASQQTYAAISERLGWGKVQLHRILFDGHDANVSMTSKTGFAVMHFVLDQLRAADMLSQSQRDDLSSPCNCSHGSVIYQHSPVHPLYYGISILRDTIVSHDLFVAAQFCTAGLKKFHCPLELLRLVSATNDLVTATMNMRRMCRFDWHQTLIQKMASNGQWKLATRNTVNRLNRADLLSGVRVYIDGSAEVINDASGTLFTSSMIAFCVSILVVTFVVMIVFQSLAMSIRCLLLHAICYTISMGLVVSVYQNGFLNWTKIAALTANDENDGCCWLVPLIAFPLIIGLGLPGDFLVMHHILEYRFVGYEHKSSIVLGLDSTGGIVCCTGMITAMVFGAPLLVSSSPFIEQLSFVVTASVLLNGLVSHTLVVPTSTAFIPFFWWPRPLPQEKFCLDEFSNQNPFRMDDGIDGQQSAGTYWEALVSSSEYEPLSPYR